MICLYFRPTFFTCMKTVFVHIIKVESGKYLSMKVDDIAFVGESVLILLIKVRKIITVSVFPYPTFVFRKIRREKFVSSMSPLDLSTLYRIVSGRKTAYLIECLGYYSNVFNLFSGRLHKKNVCFLCNSSGFNIQ